MNINGLYGRLINGFYTRCIKCIDSATSRFLRHIMGDQKHFRMMNRLNQESRLLKKYRVFPHKYHGRQTVVLMYDGSISSPGLADMLRAACATYQWCKENDRDFKLYCTSPFKMEEYLEPNQYNWMIKEEELDYSNATPRAIFSYNKFYGVKKQEELHSQCLNKILKIKTRQIHLHSNIYSDDESFHPNFHELFKTNEKLENELSTFRNEIGADYITISFRFTQLLGDLKDSFAEPLPEDQKIKLIQTCLEAIKPIIDKNDVGKTIVTSDSITFLNEVSKLPYVYLIPGEPDNIINTDISQESIRKTFWDTFMIARAKKAYMVRTPIMYTSGFAKRSAMIGGIPFEEVVIES